MTSLFDPLLLGTMTLRNRVIMAPPSPADGRMRAVSPTA